MMTFGPCIAGFFARGLPAPVTTTQFAELHAQFGRVSGATQCLELRTDAITALVAVPDNSLARSATLWAHPELRGCAILDGDLQNRSELICTLGFDHDDGELSNVELAFAAYRCWGSACLQRVVGNFILILYDEEHGLLCAADPSAERPLFVAVENDLFRFASHPLLLCAEMIRYDCRNLSNNLAQVRCADTGAHFASSRRLRPGNAVHADAAGGLEEFGWWHARRHGAI